jgi:hypothetical protein
VSSPPFDPRRFLDLAQVSGTAGQSEEHRRTAMSRAYYACFHLAKQGLERGGRWSAGATNVHERVLSELRSRRRTGITTRCEC